MLIVMLNWLYILFITQILGFAFFKYLGKLVKKDIPYSFPHNVVCGIVIATVYAQFFSLFYKVGLIASLILLGFCLIVLIRNKNTILKYITTPPHFMGKHPLF